MTARNLFCEGKLPVHARSGGRKRRLDHGVKKAQPEEEKGETEASSWWLRKRKASVTKAVQVCGRSAETVRVEDLPETMQKQCRKLDALKQKMIEAHLDGSLLATEHVDEKGRY